MIDAARGAPATEPEEKSVTVGSGPLDDYFHPAVPGIAGPTGQAEFECPAPGPPPETDALHVATNPRGQSNRIRERRV